MLTIYSSPQIQQAFPGDPTSRWPPLLQIQSLSLIPISKADHLLRPPALCQHLQQITQVFSNFPHWFCYASPLTPADIPWKPSTTSIEARRSGKQVGKGVHSPFFPPKSIPASHVQLWNRLAVVVCPSLCPIPSRLSRSGWNTMLSSLLWTPQPPPNPLPFLTASSKHWESYYILNLQGLHLAESQNSYQATQGHNALTPKNQRMQQKSRNKIYTHQRQEHISTSGISII